MGKLRNEVWVPPGGTLGDNRENMEQLRKGSPGACAATHDCPKREPMGSKNPQGNFVGVFEELR